MLSTGLRYTGCLPSEIRRYRQVGIRQRCGPLECVFIFLGVAECLAVLLAFIHNMTRLSAPF